MILEWNEYNPFTCFTYDYEVVFLRWLELSLIEGDM